MNSFSNIVNCVHVSLHAQNQKVHSTLRVPLQFMVLYVPGLTYLVFATLLKHSLEQHIINNYVMGTL